MHSHQVTDGTKKADIRYALNEPMDVLTRMMRESTMYAPMLVPGDPAQAVMPPPHARFARTDD